MSYTAHITENLAGMYGRYLAQQGVTCVVTTDTHDCAELFHYKNKGRRLVRITYESKIRFLEPGESLTIKVTSATDLERLLPKVVALNGGLG